VCNLGIAFDVLREKEQKLLDGLLARLETDARKSSPPEVKT